MDRLLIDAVTGDQQLMDAPYPTTEYMPLEPERTLWDERVEGPMPAITLGGMIRQGDQLVFDAARKAAHDAVVNAAAAEATRIADLENNVVNDAIIANLKTLTNAQIDTWFTNNITDLASARTLLRRIVKILIRRVL